MANTILIKRSSTGGNVPGTNSLSYGELALNTYDGRLFTKINSGSGPSVLDLKENDTITLSGDDIVTASGKTAITVDLNTTGVTAGSYGSKVGEVVQIPTFTVDSKGRISAASYVTFSVASDFGTIATQNANNVSISGGTIDATTIGATTASTGRFTTLESTGNLDVDGDAIVHGNLYVRGVTTTVNSTTVAITDLNVVLAKDASTAMDANGAGITVNGANATIEYDSIYQSWNLNKNLRVTGTGYFTSNIYTDQSVVSTGDIFANNVNISGSISSSSSVNLSGSLTLGAVTAASIDNTPIGAITSSTGNFTTLTTTGVTDKQIVFGNGNVLVGTTGFTYNTSTNTLTASNISSGGTASLNVAKVSSLTAGRVTFAGSNGKLVDSPDLTFDSGSSILSAVGVYGQILPTAGNSSGDGILFPVVSGGDSAYIRYYARSGDDRTLEIGVTNDAPDRIWLNATGGVTVANTLTADHLADNSLTSTRIVFTGSDGKLADLHTFTIDAATGQVNADSAVVSGLVEAGGFIDDSLTAGRVTVVGPSGRIIDNSTFTFDTASNTLSVSAITVTTLSVTGGTTNTGLTTGRVPYTNSMGAFSDDTGLTYDATAHRLTAAHFTSTGTATFGNVVTLTAGTSYTQGTYNTGTFQVTGDVSVAGYVQVQQDIRAAGTIYKAGYEVINTNDTIDGGSF